MDDVCYTEGQCKMCGCKTTALQMANKACDKPCYPAMMSRRVWESMLRGHTIYCNKTRKYWKLKNEQFIIIPA